MASASSDCDEVNRRHEEVETLLRNKITELENRLAEGTKHLVKMTNSVRETVQDLKTKTGLPVIVKRQATEENPRVLSEVHELSGGFANCCHVLHVDMAMEMCMPWLLFLPMLKKEGLFFGEGCRWSDGPLHGHLAGHLRKAGFSREDWDLTLLRNDNGDPIYTAQEEDVAVAADYKNPVSSSSLPKEQILLMERIRIYNRERFQRSQHIREDRSEYNPGDSNKKRKIISDYDWGSSFIYDVWYKCTPDIWDRGREDKGWGPPQEWIEYNPKDWETPNPELRVYNPKDWKTPLLELGTP